MTWAILFSQHYGELVLKIMTLVFSQCLQKKEALTVLSAKSFKTVASATDARCVCYVIHVGLWPRSDCSSLSEYALMVMWVEVSATQFQEFIYERFRERRFSYYTIERHGADLIEENPLFFHFGNGSMEVERKYSWINLPILYSDLQTIEVQGFL